MHLMDIWRSLAFESTRPEYIVVISCRRKLQFVLNCSIFTSSSVVWEEKDVSVAVSVYSDPTCMLSLPGLKFNCKC